MADIETLTNRFIQMDFDINEQTIINQISNKDPCGTAILHEGERLPFVAFVLKAHQELYEMLLFSR